MNKRRLKHFVVWVWEGLARKDVWRDPAYVTATRQKKYSHSVYQSKKIK